MNNQIMAFSETELENRLVALPCHKIVAFAASCTERLMPAYLRYAHKASLDSKLTTIYRSALDTIWNSILGAEIDRKLIEELEKTCFDAIPSEDDAWNYGEPYAEDAGASVVFTIRALLTCNHQEAVFAARRMYEAVDNFVVRSINSSQIDEQEILAHPLIQNELAHQRCDLERLEIKTYSSDENEVIKELRARATKYALTAFKE